MINLGGVAAIRAVGVHGDPCDWTVGQSNALHHKDHHVTYCTYCCHNTEIDCQDFKFSVFKNFLKF